MIKWWRRRREENDRIDREATELIEQHGDQAFYIARQRMVEAMIIGDIAENTRWTRIRQRIRKRTGHLVKQSDPAPRLD